MLRALIMQKALHVGRRYASPTIHDFPTSDLVLCEVTLTSMCVYCITATYTTAIAFTVSATNEPVAPSIEEDDYLTPNVVQKEEHIYEEWQTG